MPDGKLYNSGAQPFSARGH